MTYLTKLRLFLAVIVLLSGCGEMSPFRKDIREGVIEYEVSYPEMDPNNLMVEMLPNKMIMTFKGKRIKSVLSTAAGIVEMVVISDVETHEMISLAKIFSDRYMLKLDHQDAVLFSNVLPPFEVEFVDESQKIAEARCQKALIKFRNGAREQYEFYYTDEIDIPDPNWCTPYHEIKGVLLDYRVENFKVNMRLRALRITPKSVNDSEFDIDPRFRELTADQFQELVTKNMEMFAE